MLGESLRYQPGLDTLTIYPGVLSSYPNFMFDLPATDAEAFVGALEAAKSGEDFDKVVERWRAPQQSAVLELLPRSRRTSAKPSRSRRAHWT